MSVSSLLASALAVLLLPPLAFAQPADGWIPRFDRPASGLHLDRPTQKGSFAFVNVLGRRAALFGYENEPFEAWVYPMKVLRDFELAFQIEDYPLDILGPEIMTHVDVRPEATTLTYSHAAFTVRQILYAPVDEMGVVMLLDIDTVRPLTITASFRPDLRLMWPAGLMTGNLGWDAERSVYRIVEETQRFAGVVGAPGARDISVMPYQEEPRDAPTRFVLTVTPEQAEAALLPIVIAGSVTGVDDALATYDDLLTGAEQHYGATAAYYADLLARTAQLDTPDERLDTAFAWAKVGTDKGLVTNPMLGTGFVAGYRTGGASERPGFAWFFGRDALWTTFALLAYGDFAAARTALDFLAQFQRDDGKIPHEVSQSAALLDWFTDYPYPWASADATPLFIIAHAEHYAATGDAAYLRANWDALKAAFAYTAATDTDGDGLVENFNRPDGPDFGHGWVEGGELYPAREEIYMQGLWIQAARDLATLADVLGEPAVAREARTATEQTKTATEEAYWMADRGHYAFSSPAPGDAFWNEDTVLPAVPMWWGVLNDDRAQQSIDHLGAGAMATDWGARILAATSERYDPLSYHNGSVWPLFTGWASMGSYSYDRAHVGYQGLMATALLTFQDNLGYVTELLSGDYNTAFGRSSHHQVWSEAMVITPAVRGMLGLEATDGAQRLHLAPQVPATWDRYAVRGFAAGDARYDVTVERDREAGRDVYRLTRTSGTGPAEVIVAPQFPLDATVTAVAVNGAAVPFETARQGDGQRVRMATDAADRLEVIYTYEPGTEVAVEHAMPRIGARSQGLRVLRAEATEEALLLTLDGRPGRTYVLHARSPHRIEAVDGVVVRADGPDRWLLEVPFAGSGSDYVRRQVRLPLR